MTLSDDDWATLAEQIEERLDRLDSLDPGWRWSLPRCRHSFCHWSVGVAYQLEQINAWLRILGDYEGIWRFKL